MTSLSVFSKILALAAVGGMLACASSGPMVAKDVSNSVWLMPSDSHEIATLTIENQRGELVLEGKVKQLRGQHDKSGHVKVSIIGADSTVLGTRLIPLGPNAKRVDFRTTLGTAIPNDAIVVVAFDDSP